MHGRDRADDGAADRLVHEVDLRQRRPDQPVVGRVHDPAARVDEIAANDVIDQDPLAEEAVEREQASLARDGAEVVLAESIGEQRVGDHTRLAGSSLLRASALGVAHVEQDRPGREREQDAAVDREAEDEPRRARVVVVPAHQPRSE